MLIISSLGFNPAFSAGDFLNGETIIILPSSMPTSAPMPSVYMDKQTAKQFSDSLDSSFEGIGAEVGMEDGKIIIVSPFKKSPAEKAGLKPNDEIISILLIHVNRIRII